MIFIPDDSAIAIAILINAPLVQRYDVTGKKKNSSGSLIAGNARENVLSSSDECLGTAKGYF